MVVVCCYRKNSALENGFDKNLVNSEIFTQDRVHFFFFFFVSTRYNYAAYFPTGSPLELNNYYIYIYVYIMCVYVFVRTHTYVSTLYYILFMIGRTGVWEKNYTKHILHTHAPQKKSRSRHYIIIIAVYYTIAARSSVYGSENENKVWKLFVPKSKPGNARKNWNEIL